MTIFIFVFSLNWVRVYVTNCTLDNEGTYFTCLKKFIVCAI